MVFVRPADAQTVRQEDLDRMYHWAYSAAFGTGYYRVGIETVYVLKVEPKVVLPLWREKGFTTTLRLPFTVGVEEFDLGDIQTIGDIEDYLRTISFAPGLEVEIPVRGSWILRPYAHVGWGTRVSGSESSLIYYGGVNSRVELPALGDWRFHMVNGLQYFGQDPSNGSSDRFWRLVTAFEADHPLGDFAIDGRQVYFRPHFAYLWYFNGLGFDRVIQPPVTVNEEIEIGLALGIEERVSLKLFSIDRVGIAYRHGGQIEGFRIYVTSVFW